MGLFDHAEEPQQLQVDEVIRAHMLETGRWTRFLAIICFIMIALIVFGGLAVMLMPASGGAASMYGATGATLGLFYFVIAAVYLYPAIAMNKYANRIKRSIALEDQQMFTEAHKNMKGLFKYMGILTILFIILYVLLFLFVGVTAFVADTFS